MDRNFSEYDFEIIHRLGERHANADALSSKPTVESDVENKAHTIITPKTELSKEERRSIDISKKQKEDPMLIQLRGWIEGTAPELHEILSESADTKIWWYQREQLRVIDDVLYGRGNLQLLVPASFREEFLRLMHTGATG